MSIVCGTRPLDDYADEIFTVNYITFVTFGSLRVALR